MRDGPLRRSIKAIARAWFLAQLHVHRRLLRLGGGRPYQLGGECRRCAKCCEEPGIQLGRWADASPVLRRAFLWWQRVINGFVESGRQPEQGVTFFRCTHFDPVTRSCDSYASRPGICRDYPRLLLYQVTPSLFEECGYRPIDARAATILRVLDSQPMSPEQRERLERDLHLK